MENILKKLETMEDEISILKEEASTGKVKVARLERMLKDSQERIECLENQKTTTTIIEKSEPKSGSMQEEVAAIKQQCVDVNRKCERLTKLQHVLNGFILKSCDPSQWDTRILRAEFSRLSETVEELQKAGTKPKMTTTARFPGHGPSTSASSVYSFSVCREMAIVQERGFLLYKSQSNKQLVGQFISAQPLTSECPSFSIAIINEGNLGSIAIGVCPREYPPDCLLGWNAGSTGYHADNGCVYSACSDHARKMFLRETCTKDDIMKCHLDFLKRTISFYKNGEKVFTSETHEFAAFVGLHAAVGMCSVGGAVQLLEQEPWRQ